MAQFIRQLSLEGCGGIRQAATSSLPQLLPTLDSYLPRLTTLTLPTSSPPFSFSFLQDTSNFPGFVTTYMSFLSVFI